MALSKHVIDSLFEEEEMLLTAAAYVQLQIIRKLKYTQNQSG